MKKILIVAALLCCISFFANAQIQTLVIYNSTAGEVYLELSGDVAGSTCSAAYSSGVLTFSPGTSIIVAGVIPALSAGDEIALIKVMSDGYYGTAGSGCTPYAEFLLSPCTSFSTALMAHPAFTFYDGMSMGCNANNAIHVGLVISSPTVGELYIF